MEIVRRIEPTDWMRDPRLLRVAAAVEGAGGKRQGELIIRSSEMVHPNLGITCRGQFLDRGH